MPGSMSAARAHTRLAIALLLSLGGCRCGENKLGKTSLPPPPGKKAMPLPKIEDQAPYPSVNGLPLGMSAPPPEKPVVTAVSSASVAKFGTFYQPPTDPETLAALAKAASRPTGAEYDDAELTYAKSCASCHGENGKGQAGTPDFSRQKTVYSTAAMKKVLRGPHAGQPKAAAEPTEPEIRAMIGTIKKLGKTR